jgi:hypothetical protein
MRRALLAAAVLASSASPAVAQDDGVVVRLDRETPIAAHRGVLAWSERDGRSEGFRLVIRRDGVTTPAPVAPRSMPFDVDLGPTASGGIGAVYSRCTREVGSGGGADVLYGRGRGCDVFLLDLDSGGERRIAGASARGSNEFWPTLWRERIAFARTYDRKPDFPYLYARRVEGGGRSVRLPGGARGECADGRCSPQTLSRPAALDLYGRRLGFTWKYAGFAEGLDTEIRMDTIDGGHVRVAHQDGGGLTSAQLGWPAFEAGRLYFDQECSGDLSGCNGRARLSRYRISTSELDRVRAPAAVIAHDRDRGTHLLLVDTASGTVCRGDPDVPGGTCELRAVRPAFG